MFPNLSVTRPSPQLNTTRWPPWLPPPSRSPPTPVPVGVNAGPVRIGVIGGSGLYEMPGFTDKREVAVGTPFGAPSDNSVGQLGGQTVAFFQAWRGHKVNPSR